MRTVSGDSLSKGDKVSQVETFPGGAMRTDSLQAPPPPPPPGCRVRGEGEKEVCMGKEGGNTIKPSALTYKFHLPV